VREAKVAGEIWVLAETRSGEPTRATVQVLAAAHGLAAEKGLAALAVSCGGDRPAAEAVARVAGRVLRLGGEAPGDYDAVAHCAALAALADSRGTPRAILAAASARTLEVLPRLAAIRGGGYAGSCVGLRWEDDALVARRPVYGGKVYEELALDCAPAVIAVRPGAFEAGPPLDAPGEVEEVALDLPGRSGVMVVAREIAIGMEAGVDLADAGAIVAGGRGVGGASYRLVEELAASLGGAAAASRALVDAGERPHEQQVGKSGRTVSPELYIACGISGAIHHVLGMNTSKVIVAINSDPDAPIFRAADFGLVGDAARIIPDLIAAIGAAKGRGGGAG
jgi:electron transfer flavoprotein alpha subunit